MAKGQVVFEFIIAAIFFLGFVFYVFNYVGLNASAFGNDAALNDLESKAFRVGELLVTSPVGLVSAAGYPILDPVKFRQLDPRAPGSSCPESILSPAGDPTTLLQQLDLTSRQNGNYHLWLEARSGDQLLFSCGQQPPGIRSASVQRAGLLNGQVVRLKVTVW